MRANARRDIVVRTISARSTAGWLEIGGRRYRCALGRGGIGYFKREGDGKTPAGSWQIIGLLWRRDKEGRFKRPPGHLAPKPIKAAHGWCDAVGDANYNRLVPMPYPASAEELWRQDELYDVIIVLSHNHRPRVQGLGSAIFMHVSRVSPNGTLLATEGCVSLRRKDLDRVLAALKPGGRVRIGL
ncbi:MAG TPA: L,D-transpeptidase family protein [Hyphomicrobiaceae bacterium]|nr:L,D-transpeptidase family protein [Hyphomicrobiaceae bacterium]